jgi:hypothetical protein
MKVDFKWNIQCYIPEDITLNNHCCENLKSHECAACAVKEGLRFLMTIPQTAPIMRTNWSSSLSAVSEEIAYIYLTRQRHIPENISQNIHSYENLPEEYRKKTWHWHCPNMGSRSPFSASMVTTFML